MHFVARRATYAASDAGVFRYMANTVCSAFYRASRFAAASAAWLAIALPLAGCSFDLGSWGSSNDKPQQAEQQQQPTGTISAQSVGDAQGYTTRGQALAKSGKTEEALAEFDRALALDPYNVQALHGRGLIYQGEKKHQQAIEDFTAANGLKPQQVEPLLARANSYLALDKAREAASDLDEAVLADPNSAQAWAARGVTYERLGDKAKASASYGRALALRPKDDAARNGLARTGG
jgi:Tfp pilus assembly protein PilF